MKLKIWVKSGGVRFDTSYMDAATHLDREMKVPTKREIEISLTGHLYGFDESNLNELFCLLAPEGLIELELKK